MAHDVLFSVPFRSLGKSDIKIRVKNNEGLLGVLRISRGSLVWFPKGKQIGHKVPWSQFDNYMRDRPKVEKR